MPADQLEHLAWTLVGDQSEVHPGARERRQDGLDAGPAVPRVDAADVAGGGERESLSQRQTRQPVDEVLDAEELTELFLDARALCSATASRARALGSRTVSLNPCTRTF